MHDLVSYARSCASVVLFSPRRFGKTSLVRRVQKRLADEDGALTVYVDFFGVVSAEDVAARLAKAIFSVTRNRQGLWETALKTIKSFRPVLRPDETSGVSLSVEPSLAKRDGIDSIDETLEAFGSFVDGAGRLVHIALDEFQEIVEIRNAVRVEGVMRSHIQRHACSYFFIGSRRRVLLGMFNDRQRPFFQLGINREIEALPREEFARFVSDRFAAGGKRCPLDVAQALVDTMACHPHYTQKLGFFTFESVGKTVSGEDIAGGLKVLLESEKSFFEAIIQGLSLQQIALLEALAKEPTDSIYAVDYMSRHRLASTGGTQGAHKRLDELDLIERKDGIWRVVDPALATWLKGR